MPKKETKYKEETVDKKEENTSVDLITKYQSEFDAADQALAQLRAEWLTSEEVFFAYKKGAIADDTKSQVNDNRTSTSIIQRAQRTMAQAPTGKVDYLDKSDRGKNMIMNLVLSRYVIPHGNKQWSHTTKMKMTSIYSHIYGKQPVLVDWAVNGTHIVPDFTLIPINQYYPQPGVFQDSEMDYCFVDTIYSKEQLKAIKVGDKSPWKNIDKLIAKLEEKEGEVDYQHKTTMENAFGNGNKKPGVILRTRYSRSKWCTYAPEYSDLGLLREIDNPHGNNKLPVVVKQTIPLLDRAAGMGDVERAKPLQLAINSLINMFLDSAAYKLFPILIGTGSNFVQSTIRWAKGALWQEKTPNAIRVLDQGALDINTFNNLSGFLLSSVNNQLGTTDMSVSKSVDLSMGKTPKALELQQQRESAADTWERQSLEEFIVEVYGRFVDMISSGKHSQIDISMFPSEIQDIRQMYPDVDEVLEDMGVQADGSVRVRLKPGALKGKFQYVIDTGSTVQKDQAQEAQAIEAIFKLMESPVGQVIMQSMQAKKKNIEFDELFKRWIIASGIKDNDKIITDIPDQMPGMPAMGAPAPQPGQPGQPPVPMNDIAGQLNPQVSQAVSGLFPQQ